MRTTAARTATIAITGIGCLGRLDEERMACFYGGTATGGRLITVAGSPFHHYPHLVFYLSFLTILFFPCLSLKVSIPFSSYSSTHFLLTSITCGVGDFPFSGSNRGCPVLTLVFSKWMAYSFFSICYTFWHVEVTERDASSARLQSTKQE